MGYEVAAYSVPDGAVLWDGAITDGAAARYAVEARCAELGRRLPGAIRLNPRGIAATKKLDLLLRARLPITLPPVHDFPQVGFMPAAPPWSVWPDELDIYVSWMRRAFELRGDVWVFYR